MVTTGGFTNNSKRSPIVTSKRKLFAIVAMSVVQYGDAVWSTALADSACQTEPKDLIYVLACMMSIALDVAEDDMSALNFSSEPVRSLLLRMR